MNGRYRNKAHAIREWSFPAMFPQATVEGLRTVHYSCTWSVYVTVEYWSARSEGFWGHSISLAAALMQSLSGCTNQDLCVTTLQNRFVNPHWIEGSTYSWVQHSNTTLAQVPLRQLRHRLSWWSGVWHLTELQSMPGLVQRSSRDDWTRLSKYSTKHWTGWDERYRPRQEFCGLLQLVVETLFLVAIACN